MSETKNPTASLTQSAQEDSSAELIHSTGPGQALERSEGPQKDISGQKPPMVAGMVENKKVLIVDDDSMLRDSISSWLTEDGIETITASNGHEGIEILKEERIDIALTDLMMPVMDGIAFVKEAKKLNPSISVIMATGYATIQTAIKAIQEGAYDYVEKPLVPEKIKHIVENLLNHHRMIEENVMLRNAIKGRSQLDDLIYKSDSMSLIVQTMRAVAPSNATILIMGESGTGKDLVAHAIHNLSPRANGPFNAVACAALPSSLLETELFGHEKGAFTGAVGRRQGRFEVAHGGTLFLDEIGDINEQTQLGLLRAIEQKEITRVGAESSITVDVRIISATNRDLPAMVEDGRFREDLYYRLNVVTITLPPLRQRRDEILLLAESFLRRYGSQSAKMIRGFSNDAIRLLLHHNYPGNVRELKHMIERAILLAEGPEIKAEDLQVPGTKPEETEVPDTPYIGMNPREMEKLHILKTLEMADGNRSRAAKILGIERTTLYNKLKVYGLSYTT